MKNLNYLFIMGLLFMSTIESANKPAPLPKGNYQESCSNCTFNSKTRVLTCICRYWSYGSSFGKMTTLKVPANYKKGISNVNGTLRLSE